VNVYFIRSDLVHNNTGHVPINVTFEEFSRNHYCRGKEMSLTYSERVTVALIIKHATRMRHIILFSVACPTLSNSCTSSHKWHDFRESFFKLQYLF
jgi:hypothetical protein